MAMNRVHLEICGSTYTLAVDDEPEYYEELGNKLNAKMSVMLEENSNLSVTTAAILCALEYLEELSRSNNGADNLRSQLKSYLEDAKAAKSCAENAAQELQELRTQLEKSRQECDQLRREVGYMRGQEQ